ncbi:hypothetical protein LIER_07582 [Lithospermum erythrorhizon]|uniref:Uncharacterized protein n=1 Tax=Lithospermum erythrorhizon TaxID=34254 RepID=A0AAV3PDC5_LITER
MSNEKLVRKILRTLTKRFAHKVTAIEEAKDLTTWSYYTTLTDEETDEVEPSEDKVSNFVAFTGKISDDNQLENPTDDHSLAPDDSDEEDLTQEELIENYKVLFCKWSKLTTIFTVNQAEKERLTKENGELKKLVEVLRNEIVE